MAWTLPGEPPLVAGSLPAATGAPAGRGDFLAFGMWLAAGIRPRQLDERIARMRERGEPFTLVVTSRTGRLIEVRGTTVGGSAVARFRDLTGDRLAFARMQASHDALAAEVETMRAMLSEAPMPIWLRDDSGALVWVNAAYAAAVEAKDAGEAVAHGLELLDTTGTPDDRHGARRQARCSPAACRPSSPARGASSMSPTSPRKAAARPSRWT